MAGINRRYTPMNTDLSKKLLKFRSESALICVHRRFKGSKSKLAKVQLVRKFPLEISINHIGTLRPYDNLGLSMLELLYRLKRMNNTNPK
jgi:hypothetical protein